MNNDRRYLERAVALAEASARTGGFPSGALVVFGETELGEGESRAPAVTDPTAHAEILALRAAGARQGAARSAGAVLYSALEPCLMCLHAAYWGGISKIVYGAGKELFRSDYYEGTGSLAAAARALARPLSLEYLSGCEERIVTLVREWEREFYRE